MSASATVSAAPSGSQPNYDMKWTRLPVRTRPHRNPLADNDDDHPDCPAEVRVGSQSRWPMDETATRGEEGLFVDIGCAFGGMLVAMAPLFPGRRMLGLEIRPKVVEFTQHRLRALREGKPDLAPPRELKTPIGGHAAASTAEEPAVAASTSIVTSAATVVQSLSTVAAGHHYNNVWVEALNTMKYGERYFGKASVNRMFICYPDPHWKRKNVRRRIVSKMLVQSYAFWLEDGGLLYTVSDVHDLSAYMCECLDGCPLFERVLTSTKWAPSGWKEGVPLASQSASAAQLLSDPREEQLLSIVVNTSEDAQRAQRKGIIPQFNLHRRRPRAVTAAPPLNADAF